MTSIRWWGPNADLMTAARAMDRLFDQFVGPGQGRAEESGTPTYTLPVDILETENAYLIFASVPGVPSEKVDVTFEEGMLTIAAQAEPFETQGRWIRQERPWGNWDQCPVRKRRSDRHRPQGHKGATGPYPGRRRQGPVEADQVTA
jgi:HSP20 family protein